MFVILPGGHAFLGMAGGIIELGIANFDVRPTHNSWGNGDQGWIGRGFILPGLSIQLGTTSLKNTPVQFWLVFVAAALPTA